MTKRLLMRTMAGWRVFERRCRGRAGGPAVSRAVDWENVTKGTAPFVTFWFGGKLSLWSVW